MKEAIIMRRYSISWSMDYASIRESVAGEVRVEIVYSLALSKGEREMLEVSDACVRLLDFRQLEV